MAEPIKERCLFVMLESSPDFWLQWAEVSLHPAVVTYIKAHPERLDSSLEQEGMRFNDGGEKNIEIPAGVPRPSPRNWAAVSTEIECGGYKNLDDPILRSAVQGIVGAVSSEFFGHLRNEFHEIPEPHDVLSGKTAWPDDIMVSYGLLTKFSTMFRQNPEEALKSLINNYKNLPMNKVEAIIVIIKAGGFLQKVENLSEIFRGTDFLNDFIELIVQLSAAEALRK